jgi:hypothetical protein
MAQVLKNMWRKHAQISTYTYDCILRFNVKCG